MTSHFLAVTSGVLVSGLFALTLIPRKKLRPHRPVSLKLVPLDTVPKFSGCNVSVPGSKEKGANAADGTGTHVVHSSPSLSPVTISLGGDREQVNPMGESLADAGADCADRRVKGQTRASGARSVDSQLTAGGRSVDAPVISAEQVANELDAEVDPVIVDMVIEHIAKRTGKHRTIEAVWGVKKGGSKRFLNARYCYDQINAIYQAEVSGSVPDSVRDRCPGDMSVTSVTGVSDVRGQEKP